MLSAFMISKDLSKKDKKITQLIFLRQKRFRKIGKKIVLLAERRHNATCFWIRSSNNLATLIYY